uniref:PIR2-like helical domain-containing protein n=1 Tax=Opuntia streptacantha TaxID=393608 RepID=A0A7C9DSP5_OPUST
MMASMVANSSSNLSPFPTQEKGSRNKRKFRADTPLSDSGKVVPSAANDGLSYEFSAEKFEMTTNHGQPPSLCDFCGVYQDHSDNLKLDLGLSCSTMMGSSEVGPSYLREEVEANEFQDADWSDLSESQLEELMLSNLDAIFKSAIKKIVACGYTEEDATKAVLRAGHLSGTMDIVSNVVDNALAFLRSGQDVDASMEHCFEDLQQLERYVLAELVCSLREVGHFFSTGDAMWHLLICDMNVSHACTMDGDPLSSMITEGSSSVTSPSPSRPQFKAGSKAAEISLSKPYKALPTAPCAPVTQSDTNLIAGVPNFAQPKNSLVLSGLTSEREGLISLSSNPVDKPFSAVGISQT